MRRLAAGATIALLFIVTLSPLAAGHSGAAIELIAKDGPDCVDSEVCLELFSVPPDLEPGHETALVLRNHPNSTSAYAAAVTTPDRAHDPGRDTPTSAALAETGEVAPGNRSPAVELTPGSPELYAWLTTEDHEARGGYETVPVGVQDGQAADERHQTPGPGVAAALAAALAAGFARRRAT